jgi:hypothetical protein
MVAVGLGLRIAQGIISEWYRQARLKLIFIDIRDAFKLFIVARFIFAIGVFLPLLCLASQLFLFQGSLSLFIYIFLIAYEIFIILITLSKVFTTPAPHKLAFVINRYGRESLEERDPPRPRVLARKVSELLETNAQLHTESPLG